MQRSTQFVTVVLLGVVAAAMSNSQGQTQSGSATSPPGLGMPPTQTQATPSQPSALGRTPRFQTSLSVSIANGSTGGSGSFITPSAGRLVIRTVSMYRGGATAGTRVQCYLGVSSFGAFGYYAMPIVGSTGPFPGTTLAATVYADSTSTAVVNCYRNGSSGTEAESISITGYQTPLPSHDFNGDGMSDIAWRDSSGNVAIWLMNGNQLLQGGALGNADPNVWKIVGQRDFNGDGKADLLWNDTSGNVAIWFTNGLQVSQAASVASAPGWTVVGTGDFNGDGKGDILWEDASGDLAIWLMNGVQISQAGSLGTLPSGWKVAGTGDFDGDGKTDILFENTSGALGIWFMNGIQVAQLGSPPAATAAWTVVGTGDFNGDGLSDILWRDNANNLAVWLMTQGTSVLQAAAIGNVGPSWNVAETGDFSGDGKSDILWRDTSGNVAMWYMNGTAVLQYLGVSSVPLSWTIQGSNSD
jgi:hypothetical protein